MGWLPAHVENRKYFTPIEALLDQPKLHVWRYWDDVPQPVTTGDADVPCIVYGVPGKETVVMGTSYRRDAADLRLTVDAKTLGLGAGWTATDAVAGTLVKLEGGAVPIAIKSHDLFVVRLQPAK
jgi:hypothetical protein